jgi:hypothetical protein
MEVAEQIESIVHYSLPRIHAPRSEVLEYVEYSLKSCFGDDVLRVAEARSERFLGEERSLLDRRERMKLLGMPWSPHAQRPAQRRK